MEKIKNRSITPEEVKKLKVHTIPDVIFEATNELIIKHFDGIRAIVELNEIIDKVCTEETGLTHNEIFDSHYLDIEDYYRNQGWDVTYDDPAYCENYEPYFEFKIK